MSAVRSRRIAARLHWSLLPYAHPRPSAEDRADGCNWHWWWQIAYWAMKLVERLPGAYLFEPMPEIACDCDQCATTVPAFVCDVDEDGGQG